MLPTVPQRNCLKSPTRGTGVNTPATIQGNRLPSPFSPFHVDRQDALSRFGRGFAAPFQFSDLLSTADSGAASAAKTLEQRLAHRPAHRATGKPCLRQISGRGRDADAPLNQKISEI
jgi:hypothetical protein